jgi:hypothetical protein
MLRLYVQLYIVGVGLALVLLAREVVGARGVDAARFVRHSGLVALLILAGIIFGNPEAWVVRQDVARYRETGKIDVLYLTSLSLNAVPSLVASLGAVPTSCAQVLRYDLGAANAKALEKQHRGHVGHWYEWNQGRSRGLAALTSARIVPLDEGRVPGCA